MAQKKSVSKKVDSDAPKVEPKRNPTYPAKPQEIVDWLKDEGECPATVEMHAVKRDMFIIKFDEEHLVENDNLNIAMLNKYTGDLRKVWKDNAMPRWFVRFVVRGKFYVSSL